MVVKITYFVHGTTRDNEQHLASGWNDIELSEQGIRDAEKLKKLREKSNDFDVVFTSDLKRAIITAQIAFANVKIHKTNKDLRECHYGELTKKEKKWGIEQYIDIPYPKGESYKDVEKRIAKFVEFLKKNYNGKQVAIVAHQAPQLALEVLLKGRTWKQAIDEDWRNKKEWQPGWEYVVE